MRLPEAWSPGSSPAVGSSVCVSLCTTLLREQPQIVFTYEAWLTNSSGGFFAGKVTSVNDSPPEGSRFDPKAGGMGKMYRARYLKDGFFQALPLIKEVAVSTSSIALD